MSQERPTPLRRVIRILVTLAVLYVIVGAIAWFFGERVIFWPPRPSYAADDTLIMLPIDGGGRIAARFHETPGAEIVVLYSHGNAEDIGQIGLRVQPLLRLGVSVLTYDYPGYGRSDGSPSELGAYQAISAAYRYLVEDRGVPSSRVVLYGRSVGGGPTLWLASEMPVAGVITQATFVTAFRVVTRWPLYPFDRFRNIEAIGDYDGPLLILHGTEDEVIAPWHGPALRDAATSAEARFEWIEGAGHNDLIRTARETYDRLLTEFLAKVVTR